MSDRNIPSESAFRILGLWDVSTTPLRLGSVLMLLAEINFAAKLHQASGVDLCFISPLQTAPLPPPGDNTVSPLPATAFSTSPILGVLRDIKGLDRVYQVQHMAAVQSFMAASPVRYKLWPKPYAVPDNQFVHAMYDSTLRLQLAYLEEGYLPVLEPNASLVAWARQWLQQHAAGDVPIVVHLKCDRRTPGLSNANLPVWLKFFHRVGGETRARFILIGNEAIDHAFDDLPHVVETRSLHLSLSQELALISASSGFMGMSSGPCNMAIFSRMPYIIFKNPDHHADVMLRELGNRHEFSFAAPGQRFLRQFETTELLLKEFEGLLPLAVKQYAGHGASA